MSLLQLRVCGEQWLGNARGMCHDKQFSYHTVDTVGGASTRRCQASLLRCSTTQVSTPHP